MSGRHWPTSPTLPSRSRLAAVLRYHAAELGRALLRRVPALGAEVDQPRTQPLRSANWGMARWMRTGYGTAGKPAALAEIPWDYVREKEERIPFLGLREHWYPALVSSELRHNRALPMTLLGDPVVFFRDAEGRARALADRCPHRSALLSLGQVGVWQPGTLTCRYHGMTFDGDGSCVAVLTDGPDSPVCGKKAYAARAYPTEEVGGTVWIYMGEKEPLPMLDSVPHAREVFAHGDLFADRGEWPFSHLNTLDNDVDLAHPACLHHTCLPFSDQKLWGRIGVEEAACGGLRVHYQDDAEIPHAGNRIAGEVDWHLPNLAYFAPGSLGGPGCGYFWAVPRDFGSCHRWFLFSAPWPTGWRRRLVDVGMALFSGKWFAYPGSPLSCSDGADAAMMASQGRIANWDTDRPLRTDVAVLAARRRVMEAYADERAESARVETAIRNGGSSPARGG
jgi:phenylpropionate dioxygenase-like ring-hydroxylating dioxygenase large terminal subunit